MIRKQLLVALAFGALIAGGAPALAGPNDFFGGAVPSSAQDAAAGAAAGADYSDDEKRMQKKYKANIAHARMLVRKAETMMQDATKAHDDKMLKKGKILKEIGEKRVAELEANNPFGHKELPDKPPAKGTAGGS